MPGKRDTIAGESIHKFGISDKQGRAKRSEDPYIPEAGHQEGVVCSRCNAVYKNKRWYLGDEISEKKKNEMDVVRLECPACKKIAEDYSQGVVTLEGSFFWKHEKEIRSLIRNEEKKARAKNPLQRIMSITREGETLVLKTTEQKLAEHLGRAIHKAQQGDLKVSWDENHTICRVHWERNI
jgi:NMD protein affecting ribosome stability and mRNA decay